MPEPARLTFPMSDTFPNYSCPAWQPRPATTDGIGATTWLRIRLFRTPVEWLATSVISRNTAVAQHFRRKGRLKTAPQSA